METLLHRAYDRSVRLLIRLRLLESKRAFATSLSRYILAAAHGLPLSHIILGERPYGTNIFPCAASAMSYDPHLQHQPTPSVHFLALDISNSTSVSYVTARDWFRDSWKYLSHGVILLNVCTLRRFTDRESEKERVAMEEFIRDLIFVSLKLSRSKIHIYAMGNPAQHSANRIRSSVPGSRGSVVIHSCKNPAALQHQSGDRRSQDVTLGSPRVSKLLGSLIQETCNSKAVFVFSDYCKMASARIPEHSRLVAAGKSMEDVFIEIEKYFKKADSGKEAERPDDLFSRAASEMREFILALQSARVQLLFANIGEPAGTSKHSYYNTRYDYNAARYDKGSSSRVASVQSQPQAVGFVDDDADVKSAHTDEKEEDTGTGTPVVIGSVATSSLGESFTPIKAKASAMRAVATSVTSTPATARSARSISIGFVQEDSDEDSAEVVPLPSPTARKGGRHISGDDSISSDEISDMSYVSSFLDENAEEYRNGASLVEFINEAVRHKRAASDVARELLSIIKATRADSSKMSIRDSLGYGDAPFIDMPSSIMQWILKKCG